MQKIKVFHVFYSLNMGGLENGVVNLVNRLDSNRFQHEICCLSTTGIVASRLERDTPLFKMNKREGNDLRMILRLIKLIKARQPHIVHTRNWGGIDAIIAAKAGGVSRIIHGEHGWNLDDPRGQNPMRTRIRRFLSPMVDHFVAVSADIQNWLIHDVGIKREKVSVILNGVDTDKFYPGDADRLRGVLGISASDCIIGCVGRLDPIKNHQLLMKAFPRLSHPRQLHLVFLGDGPERDRLSALRESLPCRDSIHLLGQRDDVADILRTMDIFVLPSRSEGMCNALLEAMATGLPIVATAVGGNTELVQDGFNGLLVPPNDENNMVNVLNYLLEDVSGIRKRLGLNARQRAEREFSLHRMVRAYESLYLSVS
jgi:sugar transferase (PEP-CTERM/EpsH1 system associated)